MPPRKLLLVSPFSLLPPHFGSSDRSYHLAAGLARHYSVTVLCTDYAQIKAPPTQTAIPGVELITAGPRRRWAQFINPPLLLKAWQWIRREQPAILVSAHIFAGLQTWWLSRLFGLPYVLDNHNAEYVRFQRMGRGYAGLVTHLERFLCRTAAQVWCVSETDRQLLIQLGVAPSRFVVIRNGADVQQYRPDSEARRRVRRELQLTDQIPVILFFGKLDYQPNREAIDIIVREIMPRVLARSPDARFVICGYNPPDAPHVHPQLTFTGVVPRVEDYLNAADVMIVPLVSGGGTKLKVVQAIACGRPVVTTSIGAEGIESAEGLMYIRDDWAEFADKVVEVVAAPPTPPGGAWERFREEYSWDHMSDLAAAAIQETVKR